MIRRPPRSTPFPTRRSSDLNWTFVIWGGLHGGGLSAERKFRNEAAARAGVVWKWLRRIFIFHVVCLAWIFFRRSEEHTSELQSQSNLVCRLLLEQKKISP